MENKIAFRRIHGHIVPIKVTSEKLKGAAAITTGTAVAVVAGKQAHHFQVASAYAENVARMGGKTASKFKALSGSLYAKRNVALLAGAALATPLVAYGISKIREEKKPIEKKDFAAAFGVSSALAATEYYRRLLDPTIGGFAKTIKKAFDLGKARKTIQFTLKGI